MHTSSSSSSSSHLLGCNSYERQTFSNFQHYTSSPLIQGAAASVVVSLALVLSVTSVSNSQGSFFAISSQQTHKIQRGHAMLPRSERITKTREVHEAKTLSGSPLSSPSRVQASSWSMLGGVVAPALLAFAGMWAIMQRLSRPKAPTYTLTNALPLSTERFATLNFPMALAGQTAVKEVSVEAVEAAPIRPPAARHPVVHEWSPETMDPAGKDYRETNKLHVITVGVSVHSTPVEIRERLAVPKDNWPLAIEELVQYDNIQEAAVLSTCNRMEVYVVAPNFEEGVRDVVTWMMQHSGAAFEELQPYLFLKRDSEAVDHVLSVSAGLDSLVLGEGQILAQVKSVYQVGLEAKGFGQYLSALFNQAVAAGKRVRSETSIATGAVSVSSAAAELAQLKLPTNDWNGVNVAIIGAGKMSKLLVKHLVSKSCMGMTIVNRSLPRAQELQEEFPQASINVVLSDKLMEVIAASDVIFVASSSTEILVEAADVAPMPVPPDLVGGMRRFFDISVPRNTAKDLNDLPHAHVYNVDDLKEVVEMNKEARAQAADEARVLLEEEKAKFEGWMASLQAVPTIKRLRGKAEAIRLLELEKAKSKLGPDLTAKQLKVLEDLSRGITNKMLHAPMQALRSEGDVKTHVQTIQVLGKVFGLSEEDERSLAQK